MRKLRSVLRSIEKLEKLPQFRPPPSPWEKIIDDALWRLSVEHVELLRNALLAAEANTLLRESPGAIGGLRLALDEALENAAKHAGFKSFAAAAKSATRPFSEILLLPESEVAGAEIQACDCSRRPSGVSSGMISTDSQLGQTFAFVVKRQML